MNDADQKRTSRRISVDLPYQDIESIDQLKKEWGLRSRGDVLKRLLQEILPNNNIEFNTNENNLEDKIENVIDKKPLYNEQKALVLIDDNQITSLNNSSQKNKSGNQNFQQPKDNLNITNKVINLPSFVTKKAKDLRESLQPEGKSYINEPNLVKTVTNKHVLNAIKASKDHWKTLYGNDPNENVIEAAMSWLAKEIWPNLESTEGISFTWSAANRILKEYCPEWQYQNPSLERVIVLAGILEDPFAAENLAKRVPTLIRRFVNKFKRSRNVTSFQTLESTMTIHGALKLLDLPTKAGAALTLSRIRDAYKFKAISVHPDAGGSTEAMRRVNEAYQLLKDLYRKQE